MAAGLRQIVHVDMDAFYASVEQRDDPFLRGRPVVVGGDPAERGVVAAASYEARRFGVRSAMSMARAVRLCPSLIIVPPDFPRYRAVSTQVFEIFRAVTPLVEPLSLDEAYLDVTENSWNEAAGAAVAARIKARIREVTALTASAGVAPNKFLAKIASGWQKPDGLTVIAPDCVEAFLERLSIEALWGVGPVTAKKLRNLGIARLVDVRRADPAALRQALGSQAVWLRQLADGRDDRPVEPHRPAKSCGTETTYAMDLTDLEQMRGEIAAMAREDAAWLERKSLCARTVTLKIRYADFTTVTRSRTGPPTDDAALIAATASSLLDRTAAARCPVRLLGVSVTNFVAPDTAAGADVPRLPFPNEPGRG